MTQRCESVRDQIGVVGVVVDHQDAAVRRVIGPRPCRRLDHAELGAGFAAQAELVHHHLEAGQRAYPGKQGDIVDRLGQEVIGARIETANQVIDVLQSRHHDHREVGERGCRPDPPADLAAVQARHHDVEQNDIGAVLVHEGKRGLAIGGGAAAKILDLEFGLQNLDTGGIVINDQYVCRHGVTARSRLRGRGAQAPERKVDG